MIHEMMGEIVQAVENNCEIIFLDSKTKQYTSI